MTDDNTAPIAGYTVCRVFSVATRGAPLGVGEDVTAWLAANPQLEVVGQVILQSSDRIRHCVTAVIFARERA